MTSGDPVQADIVRRYFTTSPFTRLARTHALMMAGDVAVAVALAGSLFFDISPQAARWKVAAYLVFSLLPFAVIAPLIGPAIDRVRGGRRLAVILIAAARVAVSVALVFTIDTWALFPMAFLMLVLQRSYGVSKSAIVPSVVRDDDELVEANAKLGLVAGVVGAIAAIPAGLCQLVGPELTMGFAALLFAAAVVLGLQLPRTVVAAEPATAVEREELHRPGVLLAASAMALLRAGVGFLVFQTAFWFRRDDVALVWFGLAVAASAAGTFLGNLVAGQLREAAREERIIVGSLVMVAMAGFVASFWPTPPMAVAVAFVMGFSAASARAAFDAVVQRDAPDANQGRAFAGFEARFQIAWVTAAAIPVVVPLPPAVGFFVVAAIAAVAAVSYVVWTKRVQAGAAPPDPITTRLWRRARHVVNRRSPPDEASEPDLAAEPGAPEPGFPPPPGALVPPLAPRSLPPPTGPPHDGLPPTKFDQDAKAP